MLSASITHAACHPLALGTIFSVAPDPSGKDCGEGGVRKSGTLNERAAPARTAKLGALKKSHSSLGCGHGRAVRTPRTLHFVRSTCSCLSTTELQGLDYCCRLSSLEPTGLAVVRKSRDKNWQHLRPLAQSELPLGVVGSYECFAGRIICLRGCRLR